MKLEAYFKGLVFFSPTGNRISIYFEPVFFCLEAFYSYL